MAQTAPAAGAVLQLEEVVVTARKREENTLKVPVAISSLSEAKLQSAGVSSLEGLATQVPSLVYVDRGDRNTSTPGIRGIRSTELAANRQKLTTFFDGMPTIGNQAVSNFSDIGSVEVYRGPQSAVFGRAVFAGAINYLSRKADYEHISGSTSAQIGQHGGSVVSGLITGPLVPGKLAWLFNVSADKWGGPGITSSDGYRMATTKTTYGSAKLGWKVTDAVEADLRYVRLKMEDGPLATYYLDQNSPQFVRLPGSSATAASKTVLGQVSFDLPSVFRRNFCFPGSVVRVGTTNQTVAANCIHDVGTSTERSRSSADVMWDLGNAGSVSFKGFLANEASGRRSDTDNTDLVPYANGTRLVNPVLQSESDIRSKERYFEALYLSPGSRHLRFSLGASYYHYTFDTLLYSNRDLAQIRQVFSEITTNKGVFGSIVYDVNNKLTASVEARYQQEEIGSISPLTAQSFVTQTNKLLPRFGLNYELKPDVSIYAQVAKGNNPSGINIDVLTPSKQAVATGLGITTAFNSLLVFDEESLQNYELGAKGYFFDRRLRAELAVFDMEWDNFVQPMQYTLGTTGSVVGFPSAADYASRVFVNSGKVQSRGIELSGEFRATLALTVEGAASYIRTRYTDSCSPAVTAYGLPLAKTTPVACVNVTGNTPPLQPTFSGSISANLETPIANGWQWTNRIDISYVGRQFIDDTNLNWIGSRAAINLRTTFRHDQWQFDGAINNVTDNRTPTAAATGADQAVLASNLTLAATAATNITAAVPRPREALVRVSYKF
jgi:iron complex outermembrane receptor protein